MFSPKELNQLRKEFADTDSNGDGMISPDDLEKALKHLNYGNVPKVSFRTNRLGIEEASWISKCIYVFFGLLK